MKFALLAVAASGLLLSACSDSAPSSGFLSTSESRAATYSDVAEVSSSGGKTGSRSGITIPVTNDDSYSNAASQAAAHCGQWSMTPSAPRKQGNSLAYTCQ